MRILLVGVFGSLLLAGAAVAQDADPTPPVAAPPVAAPPAAEAPALSDDAAFDANFQCPETLADNDSRIDEYLSYVAWARAAHPDWSFKKRLDVRYGLLRRHACQVTLANITNSAKPAFGP